jgi:hypothetical protein
LGLQREIFESKALHQKTDASGTLPPYCYHGQHTQGHDYTTSATSVQAMNGKNVLVCTKIVRNDKSENLRI